MKKGWAVSPRLSGVVTLVWIAALAAFGVGTHSAGVRAAPGAGDAGLGLFAQMMPVFTSPRCLGCHGAVDPATDAHEGGKVDVPLDGGDMTADPENKEAKACLECHTAADRWRLAPRSMNFVGKDPQTLCRQIKRLNGLSSADPVAREFITHLSDDYFVGLAFVGQGAIGPKSPFAPIAPEPPPMSRAQFVAAAKRWIKDGRTACGSAWNGTGKFETELKSDAITQKGTVRTVSTENVEGKWTIVEGVATATVHYHLYTETSDPRFPDTPGASCGRHETNFAAWGDDVPADVSIFVTPPVAGRADSGKMEVFFKVNSQLEGAIDHEITTPPTCRQNKIPEQAWKYTFPVTTAKQTVDPKNPNHFSGTEPIKRPDGTTGTITWDLEKTE